MTLFTLLVILALIFVTELALFILIPLALTGAPFLPSRRHMVERMIRLAAVKPGEVVVDLGSGDGRFVIALAQRGAIAHGYEINPLLVLWSRWNIWRAGVGDRAQVSVKNMWDVDLKPYAVVFLFQLNPVMTKLERKLQRELAPGARVVTNSWGFPTWPVEKTDGSARLYIN